MKASDKCNCEVDKDNFLTIDELRRTEVMKSTCDFEMADTNLINENHNEVLNSDDYSNDESDLEAESTTVLDCTLENCSVVYFAGYLAKRCIDHFQCENCKNILVDNNNIHNNSNEILLKHKTFEQIDYLSYDKGLKKPSIWLINICKISLNIFMNTFETIISEPKLMNKLLNLILIKLRKENINESSCKEHYLYIIKLLIKTRIYKACKWMNVGENTTNYSYSNKKLPKLRIFEHS